jgi:broad specificity phosphatase PhoE
MAKLILIRHGQSVNNVGGTVQGSDPDPANTLNQKGVKQAYALGDLIASRRITPASVWSSPLVRARQTCDIVLRVMECNLPVNEDPRLQEMCKGLRGLPGGLEGCRREEVKTPAYREQYQQLGWDFRHGSLESCGETAREAGWRFLAAIHMIADRLADNATGLVFAHDQVIRYGGIGAALGFPDIKELDANYKLDNCESLIVSRSAKKQWRFMGRMAAS